MSTFPIRDDEYSVEEIAYEDMMHTLSLQDTKDSQADMAFTNPVDKGEYNPSLKTTDVEMSSQQNTHETELAKRLSDNANQALPDWLLNH